MADVFISYSSKDRARARQVADALEQRGHSVWWDRDIVTGAAFDQIIERELESARAVVVLWTRDSVASEWVRNEASAAADRGVLLPVSLDDARVPLEFRRRQSAEMDGWGGDASHEGFQSLCRGIDGLLGETPREPPELATNVDAQTPGRARGILIWAMVMLLLLGGTVVWVTVDSPQIRAPAPSAKSESASPAASDDLANLAAGQYLGNVISDSQGSSRSNIPLTLTRSGFNTVRVSSSYARIGTVDVELTRIGDKLFQATGDTVFILDLSTSPQTLGVNPRNELAWAGVRRSAATP